MTPATSVPHRAALFALCERVPADCPWAVTASENLALRGFDVMPGDVDVTTTAAGAHRIATLFSDRVVRDVVPPTEAETETIRSHFGALSLNGTEVELMGDVEHRAREGLAPPPGAGDPVEGGEWIPDPPVGEVREFLAVEGHEVPVMPLSYEAFGYRARGEPDRAAAVEARLADDRATDGGGDDDPRPSRPRAGATR